MVIKIRTQGQNADHKVIQEAVRALAQQASHDKAAGITALTNNSGGTAGTVTAISDFENEANDSTNLANATETDAALDTVHDALRELYTKANETATALGVDNVTYNGGGTAADGTVGAVTVSVAAATTGAQASNLNTTKDAFDNAFYQLTRLVNDLAIACGVAEAPIDFIKDTSATIAAINVAVGSAADPGVTKAAVDAALVKYRTNVKTLGDKLVSLNTAATALKAVATR